MAPHDRPISAFGPVYRQALSVSDLGVHRILRGALIGALLLAGCGGESVSATVPEGWAVHESVDLGYRMAHPAGWAVSVDPQNGDDVYDGEADTEIRIARYIDEDGWPADRIFLGAVADVRDLYGTDPALINELAGPQSARIRIYAGEYTDAGGTFFFQRAAVLTPPHMWIVDWYSPVGDEGGDRDRFLEFVQSFVPAPGLTDQQQG